MTAAIHQFPVPATRPERNIVAVLHRASQEMSDRYEIKVRRYAKLDNAIAFATKWAATRGRCKDHLIIYHELTGLELGVITVHRRGHLVIKWVFDN